MTSVADDAPLPVWVSVRSSDGVVSVYMLVETPVGIAEWIGDVYRDVGQVSQAERKRVNPKTGLTVTTREWLWRYSESGMPAATGYEKSRDLAIQAVLKAGHYVEVPPEASNPGLFDA